MIGQALIITYHGIGPGPAPLMISPALFRAQIECLSDCGVNAMTITELATALRADRVPPRAVALTFDDGFLSVAEEAAPLLFELGLKATVYCVAGKLGGQNDWARTYDAPRRRLLPSADVLDLAAAGFEIGSHGMSHARLNALPEHALQVELVDSRAKLEGLTGAPVRSFSLPYGARPSRAGRALLEEGYDSACGTGLGTVGPGADPYLLPRIDAHYVRRLGVLRRALVGSFPPYLRARRAGSRARRMLVTNFDQGSL